MKVITPDGGYSSYQKIFKDVQAHQQKVMMWQVTKSGRVVGESLLVSYDLQSKLLNLQPPVETFNSSLPVYFYLDDAQAIFKGVIETMTAEILTVSFPAEIRLLDESDESVTFRKNHLQTMWKSYTSRAADRIDDFIVVKSMKERSTRDQDFLNNEFGSVSLDEEEKMFADKRESPRMRPKADKLVKVMKKGEKKVTVMKLFDLSQGGMAFLTMNPNEFPKGTEIFVTGFDAYDLDDPLIGTVMSQRNVDELNLEFKVGVKFHEGQG